MSEANTPRLMAAAKEFNVGKYFKRKRKGIGSNQQA